MARIVVADAGPVIAFAGIDKISVLRSLFSTVSITESVRNECLVKYGVDAQRIEAAISDGWLIVELETSSPQSLSPSLGTGESDSIRFALEAPKESLLIMDDRLARRYALKQKLYIVGTVHLLDVAEQRGLIQSAEQCIQEMAAVGYRVSVDILKRIRAK